GPHPGRPPPTLTRRSPSSPRRDPEEARVAQDRVPEGEPRLDGAGSTPPPCLRGRMRAGPLPQADLTRGPRARARARRAGPARRGTGRPVRGDSRGSRRTVLVGPGRG